MFASQRGDYEDSPTNLQATKIHSKFGSTPNDFSHFNRSSVPSSTSLLKRRVIFGILAICITLSKTSVASPEGDIETGSVGTTLKYTGKTMCWGRNCG